MGRQLGYAGYMLLDSMTFLDAAGVYKTARAKTWQKEAYRCWFWGIACSVVMGAWKNVQLGRRENEVNRSQGEGAVELKMIQKYVCSMEKLCCARGCTEQSGLKVHDC